MKIDNSMEMITAQNSPTNQSNDIPNRMSNRELEEVLSKQYQNYGSIDFGYDDNYVYIRLVKVSKNNCTRLQYKLIEKLPNVLYRANGVVWNASKAAASAVITIAKEYPEMKFCLIKD